MKHNKDAVLVLGMHRSGTSAIMRGLKAIGVQLGDHLAEPAEDNIRGFWEDKEVIAFNEKLLNILGSRWDSASFIQLNNLDGMTLYSLREEGISILQERFSK